MDGTERGVARLYTEPEDVPACLLDGGLEPCTLIIFGATGDLTARKLMPALFNLHLHGLLPDPFCIVGCGRTSWDTAEFRSAMEEAVRRGPGFSGTGWGDFARLLHYQPLNYSAPEDFRSLGHLLQELPPVGVGGEGKYIFYLALPPMLYATVCTSLGRSGLAREPVPGAKWPRLVVEKPFGRDLKTASALDSALHEWFRERQIYRIDHYLAKETVQNVLVLRFANTIFEPLWNRNYIDYVGVLATERLGVGHRAGYYDGVGVLRDMFQNHMMQLLALVTMEPPSLFEADRVWDEKVKVFQALKPWEEARTDENLILGQYGPGVVEGRMVPAYREEPDVARDSLTPTYAFMRVFVDNWRWKGVPFYLVSGKRLAQKLTEIVIQFKEVPHSMFRHVLGEEVLANRLTLGIYPEERVTLTFQAKTPGTRICLRTVTMDFPYYSRYLGPRLDAYEKALIDCMQGDRTLFWREDGVEACWSFLTPILEACEACPDRGRRLHFYEAGSWGPEKASRWMDLLLGRDGSHISIEGSSTGDDGR